MISRFITGFELNTPPLPSLTLNVIVAELSPFTLFEAVYFIFEAVFKYVFISVALPLIVITVSLIFVTVNPVPFSGIAKVPALAVKVRVRLSPSVSSNVIADRSILPCVSSTKVISVGVPLIVGTAFALVVIVNVSETFKFPVPLSVAVTFT